MSISPSQQTRQQVKEKVKNIIQVKTSPAGVVHTDEEAQQVAGIIYGVSTMIVILIIFLIIYFVYMRRKTKRLPKFKKVKKGLFVDPTNLSNISAGYDNWGDDDLPVKSINY